MSLSPAIGQNHNICMLKFIKKDEKMVVSKYSQYFIARVSCTGATLLASVTISALTTAGANIPGQKLR